MRATLVAVVALLAAAPRPSVAAERPWVEAKTEHFAVISDAGTGMARELAWQFEQVRAAIHVLWPWSQSDLQRPILVLAARDEDSMRKLLPHYTEGKERYLPSSFAVTGADRYYVALRADFRADDRQGSINPYQNAYWSYTAFVLSSGFRRSLPLWFSRGLTNLMSNTLVKESSIQVGRVLPYYLQVMRTGVRPTFSDLLDPDASVRYVSDPDRRGGFDAESWAFVHYLMFGDQGAHAAQFQHFATLLYDGTMPAVALSTAFGSLDALEHGFRNHVAKPVFEYASLRVDVNIKKDASTTRELPPAESAIARASFHAAMRQPVDARAAIEAATKANPTSAGAYEVEAILLDAEQKTAEAQAAWGKAVELGSTNYYAHYRWAVLAGPRTSADVRGRVEEALTRATTLNSQFAPAFEMLASVRLQANRADHALVAAQRAVQLDPAQIVYRLTFARALMALSRRDEAVKAAQQALELARTDGERQTVQRFLESLQGAAVTPPAARSDQPRGSSGVTGISLGPG